MPLYDFKCKECNHVFERISKYAERDKVDCIKCGGQTEPLISAPRFHPFPAGWWEHITTKPLYIDSKQKLKEACEKHGKYSQYLEDS